MFTKNNIEKSKNPSKKTCPNCNNVLRFSCINLKSNDKLNNVETSQANEGNITLRPGGSYYINRYGNTGCRVFKRG